MDEVEKKREETGDAALAYNIILIVGSGVTICVLRLLSFPLWLSVLAGIPIFVSLFWGTIQFITHLCKGIEKETPQTLSLRMGEK
jgi:hypothetical protein